MTKYLVLSAGGLNYAIAVADAVSDSYTLSLTNTNGAVDVTVVSGEDLGGGSYAAGSVLTLTAHADPDYQFSGFTGDSGLSEGLNRQTITMDENKAITASFSAISGDHVSINAAWLAAAGSAPYYLDDASTRYTLHQDVTTNGTAFVIINTNITFDLNGYTITYDNAAPITVANGSFEAGTGSVATGWDFTHAPNAERFAGMYLKNEVYDGDYSLKFSSFTGDQYVVSTDTVTLEANTTYSLSGMFWNGNTNWADGVSTYAKLVGQNVEGEHIVSWTDKNWRGIQLRESVFTTGNTAETYQIIVGANNPSGAADYTAYIDDIKIQRTMAYGVAAAAQSYVSEYFPGLTRYGYGWRSVVKNGTLVQGQDNGTWCHGVVARDTEDVTVSGMSITVAGANSSAIYNWIGSGWVITDNDLTSNVQTVTSRDNYYGAVIYASSNQTISRNTIRNGPHAGIIAGSSTIDNNTIQLKVKYTNAFAIRVTGSSNVHHNTINCGFGDYAAEGIMVTNNATGTPCLIHDNTISVQLLANNQEYGGRQIEGAYALQVEGGEVGVAGCEIYNNHMTGIALHNDASVCRIGGGAVSGVYVHDNTFNAFRTGDAGDVSAEPIRLTLLTKDEIVFEDNSIETNSQYIGKTGQTQGVELVRTTLKASGDTTGFRAIETFNWVPMTQAKGMQDVKWIDTVFYDATTKSLLTEASCITYVGFLDTYSSFINAYTTTFQVTNAQGAAVANAAVTVVDKDNREVFAGTTDANGQVSVVLDEFKTQGEVKTTYSPYTATAVSGELTGDELFTASSTQTIEITIE